MAHLLPWLLLSQLSVILAQLDKNPVYTSIPFQATQVIISSWVGLFGGFVQLVRVEG
jgi:hypothetical protein